MPTVSLFAACMNRNVNLCSVLPSWLACKGVSEIVLVDWNSDVEVIDSIRPLFEGDSRLKVIRVNDYPRWYPAAAFNLGGFSCTGDVIVKMDVDTLLGVETLLENPLAPGTFRTGRLKNPADRGQKNLYGIMMTHRQDFHRVNGFNELLKFYGWADSDIFDRLLKLGLKEEPFKGRHLEHLNHSGRADNAHLNFFSVPFAPTDAASAIFGILCNRLVCKSVRWNPDHSRLTYEFTEPYPRYRVASLVEPRPSAPGDAEVMSAARRGALRNLLLAPVPALGGPALTKRAVESLDDASLHVVYALLHAHSDDAKASTLLYHQDAQISEFAILDVRDLPEIRSGVIGLTRILAAIRNPRLAGAFAYLDRATLHPTIVEVAEKLLDQHGTMHTMLDSTRDPASDLGKAAQLFGEKLRFVYHCISRSECAPIEPGSLCSDDRDRTVLLRFTRGADHDDLQAALSIAAVGLTLLSAPRSFELVIVTNDSPGAGAAKVLVETLVPELKPHMKFLPRLEIEGLAGASEPYFADQDRPSRVLRISEKTFHAYRLCLLETGFHPVVAKDLSGMARRINRIAAAAIVSGTVDEATRRRLFDVMAFNAALIELEAASRKPDSTLAIARALLVAAYQQWSGPGARLKRANTLLLSMGVTPRSFMERLSRHCPDYFSWLTGTAAPIQQSRQGERLTVTLIVSVFRAGGFIPSFMNNLKQITNLREIEVLFFDANPGDADFKAIRRHLKRIPNYRYFRLPLDPGLYTIWNIGLHLATTDIVGNANMDDLRAPDQIEVLADVLRRREDIKVACSSLKVSRRAGQAWKHLSHEKEFFYGTSFKEQFGVREMMLFSNLENPGRSYQTRCIPHCLPLWKREIHPYVGMFNETLYGYAADYELWIRLARQCGDVFWLEKRLLGCYYFNEASYMRRNEHQVEESRKLLFLAHFPAQYKSFFSGWPAICG